MTRPNPDCFRFASTLLATALMAPLLPAATSSGARLVALQTDALTEPLGIDNPHPRFSWQLADPEQGAHQTAYEIRVYSKNPPSPTAKADVWDSGRIASSASTNVPYAGPALQPSQRYFWRVIAFAVNNQPYPISPTSWFETGLLEQSNWHAEWIGHESAELNAVRTSGATWITNQASTETVPPHDTHHDFRLTVALSKPVQHATLYTTGPDTPAAWVNGNSVLAAEALPSYQQFPWATYRHVDVSGALHQGENHLAIDVMQYRHGSGMPAQAPMSAALYVLYTDGTSATMTSADPGWRAALDAPGDWWQSTASDSGWKAAVPFKPGTDDETKHIRPWPTGPVAALRKTFLPEPKPVVSARLYSTALGAYQFHLNGQIVGDQVLAPGWMDYREHVPYQVYDVTALIHRGPNAIAAYLAPGWYSTPLRWLRQGNNYGSTQPALKAQLRLQYADGSVQWVATDSTWRATSSPITFAEIYDGETRDARLEQPGWDTATFREPTGDPAHIWQPATLVPAKEPRIVAQDFPPIRAERELTAVSITQPKPGTYILDFGQNMSAVPRLSVHGSAGQQITLRFAEVLNPDGTLYVDNLRTAKATDRFTLAGSRTKEIFQPLFTFHGFRYAEITGLPTRPTPATLKALVLHTDAPFTTEFSTGDPMVNTLWKIVQWGQRSNFVGLPTDCPQRDERLGWTADAQVFWRTASYNMDLTTFTRKFSADLRGTQVGTAMYGIYAPGVASPNEGYGAAWSDAGVIIPWTGWLQSGDPTVIDQSWDSMERYLAEILHNNPNHLWQQHFGNAFGDWLTPTITTPEDLLATAYWAYDVTLMQQMALATHRAEAAERYAKLFTEIRAAFQQAYTRSDGFVGSVDHYPSIPPPTIHPGSEDQSSKAIETQTGYVLALYMHLLPEALRPAAAENLVRLIHENGNRLGTGFVGTPYLLAVLADTGHPDLAYQLLLNRQYPSWGYQIDHGATTTWERWNGDSMRADPAMNSYNHYAYGAVAEWLYRYAAGLDTVPADPGFHTVLLHPTFDPRLGHLDFTYTSRFGPIHSSWTAANSGKITWTVTIPANTSAILATSRINAARLRINGQPLGPQSPFAAGPGAGDYLLPAGTYHLTARLVPPTGSRHP